MPDQLLDVLAQALNAPVQSLGEESDSASFANWDSLRQVLIGQMLEQVYGITLSCDAFSALGSVREIRRVLLGHGIGSGGGTVPGLVPAVVAIDANHTPSERPILAQLRDELGRSPSPDVIFQVAAQLEAAAAAIAPGEATSRIAVVCSLTPDFVAAAVACGALQESVFPKVYKAPFASMVSEVLDPSSGLYRFKPDVVVLAPDWRDVVTDLPIGAPPAEVDAAIAAQAARFATLWATLRDRTGCKIIQHVLVPPKPAFRGVADRQRATAPRNQVTALNARLIEAARGAVAWVETDRVADMVGRGRWSASRFHYTSKLGFDPQFLPDYLVAFRAAWRIAHGRVRKVLALDLDNTLWGGEIGDDGLAGIRLGPDTPAGEAFAEWGAYIKALAARGVILAVCSKNAPTLALEGFEHPHSPLKASDFAAIEISWDDKVNGLRRIAQTLNVGIDSIVFADDNPFECDLVRQNLPDVAVVELGRDPFAFIDLLESEQWFDLTVITQEDLQRSQSYQGRQLAETERNSATDIGAYLRGLDMVGSLTIASAVELDRLAQMEQKTNQFNTTTRRYGAETLAALMRERDAIVLAFRMRDRHADHGLVASLVARGRGDALEIDSWLMSCRVFSRGAEAFMLNGLVALARERGYGRIVGEYRPTAKNAVVADLYPRLGFTRLNNAGHRWELSLADAQAGHATTSIAPAMGDGRPAEAPPTLRVAPDAAPNAKARSPEDIEAAFVAARAASDAGDWGEAAERWDRLRRAVPASLEAHMYAADGFMRASRFDKAEPIVALMRKRFPDSVWGHIFDAELPFRKGNGVETAARAVTLVDRFPGERESLLRMALVLREAREHAALRHVLDAAASFGLTHPFLNKGWKALGLRPASESGGMPEPRPSARRLVVFGSCQAYALGTVLTAALEDHDFEVFVVQVHDPSHAALISQENLLNAVIYYEQFDERATVPMRDMLRECLPPRCRTLTYPLLALHSLWPFDWPDPVRQVVELPRFPFGRFAYGDSVGIAVSEEGLHGEEAFARYMELSEQRMPELNVRLERDISQQRNRDAHCDVKMAGYLEEHVKKESLFFTWGHARAPIICEMARQLLSASCDELGLSPEQIEPMLRGVVPWQDHITLPIHPLVAERLGLSFVQPDATYLNHGMNWTFKEYVIRYIENTKDW